MTKGISIDTLGKEHADSNASLVKQKSSLREKTASTVGVEIGEMALSNYKMGNISSDQTKSRSKVRENTESKASLDKQKSSLREHPASSIGVESEISKTNNRQENIPSDNTASRSEDDSIKCDGKVGNILVRQRKVGKEVVRFEEKVKSAKDCGELEDRPTKKAKFDSSVKVSDNKNEKSVQKLSVDLDGNDPKALGTITASEDKPRLKLAKDSQGAEKGPSKKVPDEKTKLSNGKWLKASPRRSPDVDKKMAHQIMEVIRRPDADRSKWFRGLPWEDRMKTANAQGTLVLLQNLNPAYTSAEVEDIVWRAFKDSCTAKMIQRTSISSPHCGQAFVIFKRREAAEMVVKKLDEGCLLLPNGRPLMPREMREAVSTSHCSQPNTIEYEMAMEWCLLQERSELSWKKLYQQQWEELRKLKSSFKSK
ncbi:hypothetical protein SLA2020_411960 [Shorea laevis]